MTGSIDRVEVISLRRCSGDDAGQRKAIDPIEGPECPLTATRTDLVARLPLTGG